MILNIGTYKFTRLEKLKTLQVLLKAKGEEFGIKGTILLAEEGINLNLAAEPEQIALFQHYLTSLEPFSDLAFKESTSKEVPFSKFIVSIKPEIVTMKDNSAHPGEEDALYVNPKEFKQWMDEGRDIKIVDTRNQFELEFGTFDNAQDLHIDKFSEFPKAAVEQIDETWKDKPIVTFCTGGIRCEKAVLAMQHAGFKKVYQLAGGILKYFEECGDDHWKGECFVFDDRVAVDGQLNETGTRQCKQCFHPVDEAAQKLPDYVEGVSCPRCVEIFN